jgi:long-chain acyl-CoA synthetase
MVFSTSDHIPTLLKLAPQIPCLKMVVVIDATPLSPAKLLMEWGRSVGIKVQELHERASF